MEMSSIVFNEVRKPATESIEDEVDQDILKFTLYTYFWDLININMDMLATCPFNLILR
ncbi:hypothetical protein K469DRAFT_706324 [Zopfia rhizophila CBS 207.26]|uniref:Uncharacterized protein n=1 Tax=Zopfia rhizophila CBS 207.26 TaxID=1314779 RepID=A0A6A6ERR5_9PEZI|nr:hypothetical protein K469DRAFT_706324 [Zopfia rhizophila CBS 207.26]